jgi:membrane protease YdiL (CAAX protease family)
LASEEDREGEPAAELPGPPASPLRRRSPTLFPKPSSSPWGILVAAGGFFVGSLISAVLVAVVALVGGIPISSGRPRQVPAVVIASLVGLWVGLLGAALLTSRVWGSGRLSRDLGLRFRPWPDLPIGVAAGLGSQFVLVPAVYIPLRPSFPHLNRVLSHPALSLTGHAQGAGFAVLSLFIVLGAPVVEELFFRGLLLRSLDRRLAALGRWAGPGVAVVVTAAAFGLAHGEGLVIGLGLAVFGLVLGVLAEAFNRLGPGIVAHATFNGATVVALALARFH